MYSNFRRLKTNPLARRRGAVLVLMVLMLPVVLFLAAFAINLAYAELSRTEMMIAADAAARSGGRELVMTGDLEVAKTKARLLASRNNVAGTPLQLANADFAFGTSVRPVLSSRFLFSAGGINPNSLAVTARRTATSLDGPIPLLMPNLLGTSSIEAQSQAISTQMEVDIALVIDRSGSMAYGASETANPYVSPASAPPGWAFGMAAPPVCRWRDLVAAVGVFTTELQNSPGNELLSLSSYNHNSTTDVLLTANYNSVLAAMDVYTQAFDAGATNVGGGINEGSASLLTSPAARIGAAKVIVVMTDGIHNTGTDPVSASIGASGNGVTIVTVTFSDEADQFRMGQVAAQGNGRHFHAATAAELSIVFQEVAKSLPTLLTK